MGRLIDLSGKVFGRWTVLKRAERKSEKTFWECRCECGTLREVDGSSLKQEKSVSCGCWHREIVGGNSRTHGQTKTRTYHSWQGMKTRCTNPNQKDWKNYGGRGVTICDRWLNSFEAFLEDMGERPERKTLDRIDNNKNYEPGNCRWATYKEQMDNQRPYQINRTGRPPKAKVEQAPQPETQKVKGRRGRPRGKRKSPEAVEGG